MALGLGSTSSYQKSIETACTTGPKDAASFAPSSRDQLGPSAPADPVPWYSSRVVGLLEVVAIFSWPGFEPGSFKG